MWGKKFVVLCMTLIMALFASAAIAHDMWVLPDKPMVGKPLRLLIGYGHKLPIDEPMDLAALSPTYVQGPQGKVDFKPGSQQDLTSATPLGKGTYLVVSGSKAQFWCVLPDGWKKGSKKEYPEARSCHRSVKFAKAVVNLGGAKGDVSKPVGQELEIVPLANPATVKSGGYLPLQVLFQGKPLLGAEVYASFVGFTDDGTGYAFMNHTDKSGKVRLKAWHPGQWLVVTRREVPCADPKECDSQYYSAALAIEIK